MISQGRVQFYSSVSVIFVTLLLYCLWKSKRPACFALKVRGKQGTEPLEEFECDISGQKDSMKVKIYSDEGIHSSLHGKASVTGEGEGNCFKIYQLFFDLFILNVLCVNRGSFTHLIKMKIFGENDLMNFSHIKPVIFNQEHLILVIRRVQIAGYVQSETFGSLWMLPAKPTWHDISICTHRHIDFDVSCIFFFFY